MGECSTSHFKSSSICPVILSSAALVDETLEPVLNFGLCLFHECPHGQTIDETARPFGIGDWGLGIGDMQPVPEPGEGDGGGFAETSGDVDELRAAWRASIAPRQAGLVVVGGVAGGGLEKVGKVHATGSESTDGGGTKAVQVTLFFTPSWRGSGRWFWYGPMKVMGAAPMPLGDGGLERGEGLSGKVIFIVMCR